MTLTHLPVENYTRLLVIAPQPDDETLTSAGLMQLILAQGGEVEVRESPPTRFDQRLIQ